MMAALRWCSGAFGRKNAIKSSGNIPVQIRANFDGTPNAGAAVDRTEPRRVCARLR